MAIKTEIKDGLLWLVSFSFFAMLWYLGWMYEGMREVFLTAPMVLVMLLLSRRAPWWGQAVVMGITGGIVFFITQGYLKTLLLASPPSADQMLSVFVVVLLIVLESLTIVIVIDKNGIEAGFAMLDATGDELVGTRAGLAGLIVGGVIGGATAGAITENIIVGEVGALAGAMVGLMAGLIAGALVGALAGALAGTMVGLIAALIAGALVGALAATGKWFLFLGINQQVVLLSLVITSVVFSLFLAISAFAKAREKRLWDYPLFPLLASAAIFPLIFAPILRGAFALSIPPWAQLYLGFGIYGLFFLPLWLVAALVNKPYQYFLKGSRLEKSRWEFVSSHPHLLCRRHLTRTTKRRVAMFYKDIHCLSQPCDSNSFYKVKKVIGVIDRPWPNDQVCRRDGDKLYVNIVKPGRETRSIDLDVLEVRYAEDLDYLLQQFLISYAEEHAHHDSSRLKKVPVVLKCKKEDIHRNAYHLAKDRFKTVIEDVS